MKQARKELLDIYMIVIAIALSLFVLSSHVLIVNAQDDETPVSTLPDEVIGDSEIYLTEMIEGLSTLVYLPFAGTLVLVLTALSKRLPFVKIDARLQSLAWSVLVWVAYIAAARAGYEQQFTDLIPGLATVIATIAGVTLTPAISSAMYSQANQQKIPVLGYSKSPEIVRAANVISQTEQWHG